MASSVSRALSVMDLLSAAPDGMPLGEIAERLGIPRSAAHRHLSELVDEGYVRKVSGDGDYALSMKLASVALRYLSHIDLVYQAQPAIDRLARASGALARLGIIDGETLTWVLKVQGATSNLRYDPPLHQVAQLAFSASGHAWLSCFDDEEALAMILRQGIPQDGFGSGAPRTIPEILELLHASRARGYAIMTDSYDDGISAVAAPIVDQSLGRATGVLSVAGSSHVMTPEMLENIGELARREAANLADARLELARYLRPAGAELRPEDAQAVS